MLTRCSICQSHTCFFFQAEDGIRDYKVTGVQTCALPICSCTNCGSSEHEPVDATVQPGAEPRLLPERAGDRAVENIGDPAGEQDGEQRRRGRSEEHTSELQSPCNLVCRLLLEKKKQHPTSHTVEQATGDSPRPNRQRHAQPPDRLRLPRLSRSHALLQARPAEHLLHHLPLSPPAQYCVVDTRRPHTGLRLA